MLALELHPLEPDAVGSFAELCRFGPSGIGGIIRNR
jgi:hypothetical protein